MYVNATEHTRIVYAGHYAGLCYTTDGRTHQCTGDIAMMRSIPGMKVLYPAFEAEIGPMLEWYRSSAVRNPLYIRLHRTPAAEPTLDCAVTFEFGHGIPVRVRGAGVAVLTSGPHCVSACARASDALQQEGTAPDLYAVSTLRGLDAAFVTALLHHAVTGETFSTRSPDGLYRHFQLTVDALLVREFNELAR